MRSSAFVLLAAACASAPRATLGVTVSCQDGQARGVIVSPSNVLTAKHVVLACGGRMAAAGVPVELSDTAEVDAALLSAGREAWRDWARTGPSPLWGEEVCAYVSVPRAWHCAPVEERGLGWIHADLHAVPGDSGAGVWRGARLVGIVSKANGTTEALTRDAWGGLVGRLPQVSLGEEWP